jgi:Cytochrome P450
MKGSSFRRVRLTTPQKSSCTFADACLTRCLGDREYMVRCTQSFVEIMIHRFVCRAILHDPDVYPEPEVFNPDRFLTPDGTLRDDPTLSSVFGFGKRICPGKHLVDATLFIFTVTVLSVLRIEKRRDSGHRPFEYTYSGGLVRCDSMFSLEVEGVNCHVLIKPSKRLPMLYHCKGQNCRRAYFGRMHSESLNHDEVQMSSLKVFTMCFFECRSNPIKVLYIVIRILKLHSKGNGGAAG